MNYIDLKSVNKVYFLGIGGIGVSAIALMMNCEGKHVSGTDTSDSLVIENLREHGIGVDIGPNTSTIPAGTDLVVYTRALEVADASLLEEVRATGVSVLSYPEVLRIISERKYTVAVSGMHGKTTTTAMCSHIWSRAGKSPTTVVGSMMKDTGSNYLHGDSEFFIVEADEYRRSFHNLWPKVLIITNIEEDHLDYYKDIVDIQDAFKTLADRVAESGAIVCNPNDPNTSKVIVGMKTHIIDYTTYLDKLPSLLTPGRYNRSNAACAVAAAVFAGIPEEVALAEIGSFVGTWRRFEYIGTTVSGADVYDDYAHHPTEVAATLGMVNEEYPGRRVFVVFHPHLYSRTKLLLPEFAKAFADSRFKILLLPIYPAREENDPSISSNILSEEINKLGGDSIVLDSFLEIEAYFTRMLGPQDIVITMGAGESNKVAYSITKHS